MILAPWLPYETIISKIDGDNSLPHKSEKLGNTWGRLICPFTQNWMISIINRRGKFILYRGCSYLGHNYRYYTSSEYKKYDLWSNSLEETQSKIDKKLLENGHHLCSSLEEARKILMLL